MTAPIVGMRGICKRFGPVQALIDVNLRLAPGEVLGLVGDNSAGKSTLMKILTGADQCDGGHIRRCAAGTLQKPAREPRPRHRDDLPGLCAVREPRCRPEYLPRAMADAVWNFVDRMRMHDQARAILNRLKVDVTSVHQKVESLSGGRQQSVAIARAISFAPKVVTSMSRRPICR